VVLELPPPEALPELLDELLELESAAITASAAADNWAGSILKVSRVMPELAVLLVLLEEEVLDTDAVLSVAEDAATELAEPFAA